MIMIKCCCLGYRTRIPGLRRPCRASPAASAERASLRKLLTPSSFPTILSNISFSRVIYDAFRLILNHLFCWNDVVLGLTEQLHNAGNPSGQYIFPELEVHAFWLIWHREI